jgi:hypothetical protein
MRELVVPILEIKEITGEINQPKTNYPSRESSNSSQASRQQQHASHQNVAPSHSQRGVPL